MIPLFLSALAYLFGDEGQVFVDDPRDSGGATFCGITQKAWNDFKKSYGNVTYPNSVKDLTDFYIANFYSVLYWTPLYCHLMVDAGITIAIFDTAVLYGLSTTIAMIQQALILSTGDATILVDGKMGPLTLEKLNATTRATFLENFVTIILHRIEKIVKDNPKNVVFENGWKARADKLLTLNGNTVFNYKAITKTPQNGEST